MTEQDRARWLPEAAASDPPRPSQERIITSDPAAYPIRVIAGAGTGKTYTMIRTVEHLIEEEGVNPRDVLAVTFTNKAADSMQGRLHATLGHRGYDVTTETYHSLCHKLLSAYAYHADLDPAFEIATETEQYLLVLDCLDDLTYRFVEPDVHDRSGWGTGVAQKLLQFVSVMKRSGITPGALDDYLGAAPELVELSELPDAIEDLADEHLRGTTGEQLPGALDRMARDLQQLREEVRTGSDDPGIVDTVEAFLDAMIETCERMAAVYERRRDDIGVDELADAHKLPAYLFGSYSGPPAGIPDVGFTFTDKLAAYLDSCLVARDLTDGYAAYNRQLAANEFIDFDDAIGKTVDLLRSDVGEEIAADWEYVFCDEFQDTDPLQFALIRELVTDGRLFVVGDDDQAIYGWRGAEVDNIKGQLEDAYGAELTDKELTENFRSHQPILDLANSALEHLDNRVIEKSLSRFEPPEYSGDPVATVTAADEETDWGEQLRNVITHLLAGEHDAVDRAYDPGEIAILTRKHRHATPIVEALAEIGVPCERPGGSAPESVGIGTVTAYLRALAAPEADEVSLNRVLLLRYRVPDADLRRLNVGDEPLIEALLSADPAAFEAADRIAEAQADLAALLAVRDRYSVARLYRELKARTNIEWYLTDRERRDLQALDRFVAGYGEEDIQPMLDEAFIDILDEQDDIETRTHDRPTDQPDLADDAINVMTVFKAKGLDFPVVIIPELDAGQWSPQGRSYGGLETAVRHDPAAPVAEDLLRRDGREARRVLHVGLTRAEEVLVLAGRPTDPDTGEDRDIPVAFVEECLGDSVGWTVGGVQFPVWADLQRALPPEAADWTDTLAAAPSEGLTAEIQHGEERLSPDEARTRLLALGRAMLAGELGESAGPDPVAIDRLREPADAAPSTRHSYTSLETFAECERKHYLEYVVGAFEDPVDGDGGEAGVSQREIGVLFHETAERAALLGLEEKGQWEVVCERIAEERNLNSAVPAVKECIDRFFASDAAGWDVLAAERAFTLSLNGHTVTGVIDAVARRPDGEVVVADYKATRRQRNIDESLQLPLYAIVANELLDIEIRTAAYVYVGDIGPAVEMGTFDRAELEALETELVTEISAVEAAGYSEYTLGEHCEWCPHRSLPCGREYRGEPAD